MRPGLQRLLVTMAALAGAGFVAFVQESPREVVEYTCSTSYSIAAVKIEQSMASGHRYAAGTHLIKAVCCSIPAILPESRKLSTSMAGVQAPQYSEEASSSHRPSLFQARAPPFA